MSPSSASDLTSVVIPCFNQGRWLGDAVDSVLSQTREDWEIVVVDDGSTDAETTEEVRRQAGRDGRIRAIRTENRGLPAARNNGIKTARGCYILPLDADDMLAPAFLEKTVPVLAGDEGVGVVYTDVQYFGASRGTWKTPEFDLVGLLCSNLMTATSLFRRSAWERVGGYREDMRHGFEDWDFWISLCELGLVGRKVGGPLFRYRQHAGGSMLASTQARRSDVYRQIVRQHRELYVRHLEDVLVEKDRMFFEQLQAKSWYQARFQRFVPLCEFVLRTAGRLRGGLRRLWPRR